MAYEKTTWVDGETEIDAQKLNKMEEGIVEASQTGGILTGTIVAYDGDTIPEGYEEVDGLNDYSTEEKVIGKWIDGKPLYRKTYNAYRQDGSIYYIDETDFIKKIDIKIGVGTVKNNIKETQYYYKSSIGYGTSDFGSFVWTQNFPDGRLFIQKLSGGSGMNVVGIEFTIYYTKTTD